MKDKFKDYNDLKNQVIAICDVEEKKRVEEEFELFEKRNWQKYIILLCNAPEDIVSFKWNDFNGGSVLDSYVLYKTQNEEKNSDRLNSKRGLGVLLNDALRLNMWIHCPSKELLIEKVRALSNYLDSHAKNLGLEINQKQIPTRDSSVAQIAVISEGPISEKEIDIIINEGRESTEEEAALLRKHLIWRIGASEGI